MEDYQYYAYFWALYIYTDEETYTYSNTCTFNHN